jgi:hypothetical protein
MRSHYKDPTQRLSYAGRAPLQCLRRHDRTGLSLQKGTAMRGSTEISGEHLPPWSSKEH